MSAQGSKAISLDRPTTRKDRSALPRTHPTARPASAPPSSRARSPQRMRAEMHAQLAPDPGLKPWHSFFAQPDFRAIFQGIGAGGPARNYQNHRTFGCRHRHMDVGDFSAQYLTDAAKRRFSACAALRFSGVTFFRTGQSARRVPAGRKRHERPDRLVVVGGLWRLMS